MAGEEKVFRVEVLKFRTGLGALAVGSGEDDFADDCFSAPAAVDELGGEPVEKFGVGGPRAHETEILGGFDDAGAEEFLPDAVDRDAADEGVVGGGEPVGEVEAGGGAGVGCEGRKEAGGVRGDGDAEGFVVAADAEVGLARGGVFGEDIGLGERRVLLFEGFQLLVKLVKSRLLIVRLADGEVVVADEVVFENQAITVGSVGGFFAHDALAVAAFGEFEEAVPGQIPVGAFAGLGGGLEHVLLPGGLEFANLVFSDEGFAFGVVFGVAEGFFAR